MRIAAITNSRIPSLTANSIQAMKVCDALVEAGNEVHLFAPAEGPRAEWVDLANHYGLRHPFAVRWLPSRRSLRRLDLVYRARMEARQLHCTITYTWLPQAAAVEAWTDRPVILEMHADVAGRLGAWWLRQFWRSNHGRLLVTTGALLRALEKSTGMRFPAESVQVAPNGVDLHRYDGLPNPTQARAALGLRQGFTAGFTGHFYRGRGMDLLLQLSRGLPGVQFLWVGGTADVVEEWRARLQQEGQSNVQLTGFVENSRLPMFQAASEVLLMPYSTSVAASSGQDIADVINPMKMFEYMGAERPIITSSLPVIREVLNEELAVFCDPQDASMWMSAIRDLAANGRKRSSLAHKARREVEKYTWLARARRALEGMPAV